jgi:two-component system, sensor histidine kinase and response regulator
MQANVLVVDDTAQNLVAMEALLSRPGLTLLKASSGVEALELLLANDVALALLDVNMPTMDGFELAELIRGNAKTRTIPIIFITAALHEPLRIFRGYQSGAVDFIIKPFDPETLRSKVNVFVDLYAQRKDLSLKLVELEEALMINEMFVAVLGHDLRTPIAVVTSGAEVIARTSDQEKVVSCAGMIQSSAARMEKMVAQLLDVARARSGNIELHRTMDDYRSVCCDIIQEFTEAHQPSRIRLVTEGDTRGVFDRVRVAQIFSNLIGNALHHGNSGGMVRVFIDGTQEKILKLRVENEGHIPVHRLAAIFEPFKSAMQRDKVASSGLGLGLYIVKQFVSAHGGVIEVASSEQDGTSFTILMPRGA